MSTSDITDMSIVNGNTDDSSQERTFTADEFVIFLQNHCRVGESVTALAAVKFGASQKKIDEVLGPQRGSFSFHRNIAKEYGHLASEIVQKQILEDLVNEGLVDWAEEFVQLLGRKLNREEVLCSVKLFCEDKTNGWKTKYTEEHLLEFVKKNLSPEDVQNVLSELQSAEPKKGLRLLASKPYTWGQFITI